MTPVRIVGADLLRYDLPLRRSVRGVTRRRGWIVRLSDADGHVGLGDAACWPGFGAGPTRTQRALVDFVGGRHALIGRRFRGVDSLVAWRLPRTAAPEACHAIELAVLDLLARAADRSLAALLADEPRWNAPRRRVPVHVLVADREEALRAVRGGATVLKVKVGACDLDVDDARVAAIRRAVGASVSLRLDANGAWSPTDAVCAARRLARHDPEWIEQPVAPGDVRALARVREVGVRVAVDEGIRCAADLHAVADAQAADVVVLKPMFLGGLLATRELTVVARARGLEPVVTDALESAVGRIGALHLVASLDLGPCGLSDPLADDLAEAPRPVGGALALPPGPGLGVSLRLRSAIQKEVAV